MRTFNLKLISDADHNSQIVTGFLMLAERNPDKYNVKIQKVKKDESLYKYGIPSIVECEYQGMSIAYDTADGYYTGIESEIDKYDIYFKRSFSKEKNKEVFGNVLLEKVYPLGFNYHVAYKGNPYNDINKTWKTVVRGAIGRKNNGYFTPDKFEGNEKRNKKNHKIIFFTRLWEPDQNLGEQTNDERRYINEMRIEILVKLRELYGENFIGGLTSTEYEQRVAPELVVPRKITRRENYLKLLKETDIAIGTMGLHESIGWKTGEYVASGRAIVNERFHYEVPGNFEEGKNYIPFENAKECINAVNYLIENPEETMKMQSRNKDYYTNYLRPDKLIERTIHIVDERWGLIK